MFQCISMSLALVEGLQSGTQKACKCYSRYRTSLVNVRDVLGIVYVGILIVRLSQFLLIGVDADACRSAALLTADACPEGSATGLVYSASSHQSRASQKSTNLSNFTTSIKRLKHKK